MSTNYCIVLFSRSLLQEERQLADKFLDQMGFLNRVKLADVPINLSAEEEKKYTSVFQKFDHDKSGNACFVNKFILIIGISRHCLDILSLFCLYFEIAAFFFRPFNCEFVTQSIRRCGEHKCN